MKLIIQLALVALLPFLSGCYTAQTLNAAKAPASETILFGSVDKIEKAGITKDGQLYIFFEKDLTNSPKTSRFSLAIPLVQIQTNSGYNDWLVATNDHGAMNIGSGFFPKSLYSSPDRHTWRTLQVPGGQIRKNWPSLTIPDSKFIPVATALTHWERYTDPVENPTVLHDKDFILLSNATQTVYLTRTAPIEFVYVDASTNQSYTIVKVDPTVVTKRHPAKYAWLPLTVPADIILSPFEFWIYLEFKSGNWHM